jgi:hypothetical protein
VTGVEGRTSTEEGGTAGAEAGGAKASCCARQNGDANASVAATRNFRWLMGDPSGDPACHQEGPVQEGLSAFGSISISQVTRFFESQWEAGIRRDWTKCLGGRRRKGARRIVIFLLSCRRLGRGADAAPGNAVKGRVDLFGIRLHALIHPPIDQREEAS